MVMNAMFFIFFSFTVLVILLLMYQFYWWKKTPEGNTEFNAIKNSFKLNKEIYQKDIQSGQVILLPAKIKHIPNTVTIILWILLGLFLLKTGFDFNTCEQFFGFNFLFLSDVFLLIVMTGLFLVITIQYWMDRKYLQHAVYFPNPKKAKWFGDTVCKKVDKALIKEHQKSSRLFIAICAFQLMVVLTYTNLSSFKLQDAHKVYLQKCKNLNQYQ